MKTRQEMQKLLVPRATTEASSYNHDSPMGVRLPQKDMNDVFPRHMGDQQSSIDVASDDVNWYSFDKNKPQHAPGYVAKIVAVDPKATDAFAATLAQLARHHNTNLAICWFEFLTGDSQPPAKKLKVSFPP
jgi:hypothetical protein